MNQWRLFAPAEDWRHPMEVDESALSLLTTLAERLGLRMSRDDAQRKFYNRSVGGVSNSAHIDGLAADISGAGISTETLWRVCEVIIGDDGGVGYYPNQQFCHVDVRGYRSRWQG